MRSEAIDLLAAALVKAQAEFSTVPKTAENLFFHSKYADLATVMRTAAPVLNKNGLAVSQFVSNVDGASSLTTYLIHNSGQFIAEAMPLLMSKQDPQGQGSAIAYARRYSYMSVLGLVADEDDDGNKATTAAQAELIPPADMKRLKELMSAEGMTGERATEYAQMVIGKDKPTTKLDVQNLIAVLTADVADSRAAL